MTDKLDIRAFALGGGVMWSLYVMLDAWIARFGWGDETVETLSSLYIGYRPTLRGSLVGALWGFMDGALGGAIVATVYNAVARDEEQS
ncbi:bacteriophage holin [Haladaptatus sp. T7]|uniref:bacteriophage holin n=1 Tax=Haladaptatus sp. T7 TaxID=2029368 RepID=UPI0021A254C2|nr:bacteriophage holin [Haladaptatus sp. T7]GKZ13414.1 hypothetical protein HAL_12950 [Haladaptatus sp. T7]